VDRQNEQQLLALLDAALGKPLPAEGTPERKVLEVYRSGMRVDEIRRAGLKPLAPLLEPIARMKDGRDLPARLGGLHAADLTGGFEFDVTPERKDSSRYIAELTQGGLGLPDRDYYLLDDERLKTTREAYRAYVVKLLVLNGDGPVLARRNADAILALETE